MAKISMAELAAAAKEMNSVMGLQPKIKTVGVPEKALTEAIKVNAEEIDPETDEFSEETIDTLKALGAWPGEEVEEETDPDEEIEDAENEDVVVKMRAEKQQASKAPAKEKKKSEPEPDEEEEEEEEVEDDMEVEDLPLEDRLQSAKKMEELKAIITDFPEVFTKKVVKGFAEAKNPIMLKKAMKEAAGIAPAEKTEKVEKVKKEKTPSGPGVIASIAEFIEKAGKKGIKKEDILSLLVERFPDRDEKSMKSTINVQIPGRMSKEKFEIGVKETGEFFKK